MQISRRSKRLPFEQPAIKKEVARPSDTPFKQLRKWNLTLRGTVLLACVIFSTLLLLSINSGFSLSLLYIPVIILIWRGTFAHFEAPFLMPLNVVLNTLLLCPFLFIPLVGITEAEFVAFLPLVIGMTALSSIVEEGRVYFYKADFGPEVLLPMLTGFVLSLLSFFVSSFLFERQMLSVQLVIVALLVVAGSALLSKIYSKPIILSSQSDFLPDAFYINDHVTVLIAFVLMFALTIVYKFLMVHFGKDVMFFVIPILGSLVAMSVIYIARSVNGFYMMIQIIIGAVIMLQKPSVFGLVAAVIAALLFTLVLLSYRGHKLLNDKSIYLEGLPILLVLFSIVLLIPDMMFFIN